MMNVDVKRKIRVYAIACAIPLAVGLLSALLTNKGMQIYQTLQKPPLSPPGWIFPVAWTILYLLMGISSGMVYLSGSDGRRDALRIYALQLLLNFGWTILFFGFHLYLAAFIWLVVLEALIVVMIALFYAVRPLAGYLQIPYFFWVAFAAYLNFAVYLLNM